MWVQNKIAKMRFTSVRVWGLSWKFLQGRKKGRAEKKKFIVGLITGCVFCLKFAALGPKPDVPNLWHQRPLLRYRLAPHVQHQPQSGEQVRTVLSIFRNTIFKRCSYFIAKKFYGKDQKHYSSAVCPFVLGLFDPKTGIWGYGSRSPWEWQFLA